VTLAAWMLVAAAPATASHHLVRIREVFAGVGGQPGAQFVRLQAYSANQNVFFGSTPAKIQVYAANGSGPAEFSFTQNLANAASQMNVLVATGAAGTYFGIAPDLTAALGLDPAGGKVCFVGRPPTFGVLDCFSWGSFAGSSSGSGTPFNVAGGIPNGLSALRDISGGSSSTLLDSTDDTGSSSADFDAAPPQPVNNAGTTMTTAPTVAVTAGQMRWQSTANVANKITLSGPTSGVFTVTDTAAPLRPGAGCTFVHVGKVTCTGVTSALLDGGLGNDVITSSMKVPTTASGGDGTDKVTTGNQSDTLNGGAGTDTLDGGFGADTLNGGTGADTATYAARTVAVLADLDAAAGDDGNANDGALGSRDTIAADVENLTGGKAGADQLTGNAAGNVLDGGFGADTLTGLGGTDTVTYAKRTTGVDVRLDGVSNDGNADDGPAGSRDTLNTVEAVIGGPQGDFLQGSTGANKLTGGLGADTMRGLAGNDTIVANDGVADDILCGLGDDKLYRDAALDTFPTSGNEACEQLF
jgi:Ca2+-binding RTX toxin-like protein